MIHDELYEYAYCITVQAEHLSQFETGAQMAFWLVAWSRAETAALHAFVDAPPLRARYLQQIEGLPRMNRARLSALCAAAEVNCTQLNPHSGRAPP